MAKACWEELGTWNQVFSLSNEADGFVQWMFKLFQKVDVSTLENIAMVLWGIWRARKDKLWNKIVKPAKLVVSLALQLLTDWREVCSIERTQARTNQHDGERVTWQKPQAQALKCNVDASVHNGSRNIGVGMVLRGSDGLFISSKTNLLFGRVGIEDAEEMAFKEALSWVEGMNVQDVIFESDSKVVVEAINLEREDDSEFGAIISECREVLRQRPSFSVCFTRRQAIKVAHNLARASCFYARHSIWNTPPDFIFDVLNEDCNSLDS
ncbi:uncharacterized protein [Primulina huaijiensis]|uniref:uncharacterized protein n=1 Tax=Primulina huaijiensis TaxID=1492673 RepID=UPI003CC71C3A